MKQRVELVVLGILIVLLAAAAFIAIKRPKVHHAATPSTAPAEADPRAKEASLLPLATTSETKEQVMPAGAGALPTRQDLGELASWVSGKGGSPARDYKSLVFGLAPPPGFAEKTVAPLPPSATAIVPPPRLDGILWSDGGKAVIQGVAYPVGAKVANTDYTVAKVTDEFVLLKRADGKNVKLVLGK